MSNKYFIGLMIGSSLDGIDGCILDTSTNQLIEKIHQPIDPIDIKSINKLNHSTRINPNQLHACDQRLGYQLADTVQQLLKSADISPLNIGAIGVHGATIRHQPQQPYPYSWQLGNAHIIATKTGITTISDFRNRDMILGGQGAPLAPLFHREFINNQPHDCLLVNIGGIANISYLPKNPAEQVIGFDSGPGNTLIDSCMRQFFNQPYDKDGSMAKQGDVDQQLLAILLNDPYFKKAPPKSTGRDKFNMAWAEHHIKTNSIDINHQNQVATLTALTAKSIANCFAAFTQTIDHIYICGGGAHNSFLLEQIQKEVKTARVCTTSSIDIDPDFIEAMGFAWLAKQHMNQQTLNTKHITGNKQPIILGTRHIG